jgi:succinoglycan biosynthesis transport protein ExoP
MDTKIPDAPETKLHFLDYWRIIRLRKTVILIVFFLIFITTAVVTYLLPKTYASNARIKIEKDLPFVKGIEGGATSAPYDPFWLQTEFDVIRSSSVLNDVIKKLDLNQRWSARDGLPVERRTDQTYELLKRQTKVNPSRNTSLVEIWAYSEDQNEAVEIANAIADAYRDYRLRLRKKAREEGVASLIEQLKQREEEVKEAQQTVNELRLASDIPDLETSTLSTTTLNIDTLRGLEQLRLAASQEFTKEVTLLSSVNKLDRTELRNSLSTIYPFDQLLVNLSEKLTSGRQQLTALLKELTPEHTEVKKAQSIVDLVESQLDEKIDGILMGLQANAETAKAKLDEIERQVREARANEIALAAKYRPYFDAKRKLENKMRITEALSLRIAAEIIETAQPTAAVEVIDKAVVMPRPVRPNITFNIGLGIVVGLIVGVGLAFFIEYLDTSVKTIDDVERALQAPVLGVIPQNVGVLLEEGSDTPHAEAYRVLRTNVLFSRKDENFNTLTVLSGGAGEGKSTTLLNLATSFAQNGSRCLIVDSDLRRPSIHKVLRVSNSIGFTNYLLKQNTLEEVIQTTVLPTLDFMPSGKLPSSSMGILSSEKMKELILDLKRRYDFVFFDSPPLLGVSDASILASEVDMILQVVQYRRYPQPMTIRAKQMIQNVGGNLLGIVLNNISMSQDENYYYYSGYYENSKHNDEPGVKSRKTAKRAESANV